MKAYKSLLICLFAFVSLTAHAMTITVVGTGLTGLWTAYSICKDLEEQQLDESIDLVIIGKWNWLSALEDASKNKFNIFLHETSGFGPIGIQPHSGLLWNTDNEVVDLVKKGIGVPDAAFYTAPNLEEAGREFLELYTGWHARHPDQQNDPASSFHRQRALVAINRYARELWGKFYQDQGFNQENNPLDFHLEGAWRLYDSPVHYANALKSLSMLEKFDYGAEAVEDPLKLAERVPFYKETILRDGKQGIFFRDDGLINSNKLRLYLWDYLSRNKSKSRVVTHLDAEVTELIIDADGNCRGVVLENEARLDSNVTILAMGLANRPLLNRYGVELPLWSVWGAAVQGELKNDAGLPPKGGVSFHSQRCITAAPDGKTMIVAGTSMVVNSGHAPCSCLYKGKLLKNLAAIFGNRVNMTSLIYSAAPRTGIADDLPVIGFDVPGINRLLVLNPTSHLGNTQSIALGKLTSLYILQMMGRPAAFPGTLDLHEFRLDRFKIDIQQVRQDRRQNRSILW